MACTAINFLFGLFLFLVLQIRITDQWNETSLLID